MAQQVETLSISAQPSIGGSLEGTSDGDKWGKPSTVSRKGHSQKPTVNFFGGPLCERFVVGENHGDDHRSLCSQAEGRMQNYLGYRSKESTLGLALAFYSVLDVRRSFRAIPRN